MIDVKKYSPHTVRYIISCLKTLLLHNVDFSDDPREIYHSIHGKYPTRGSLNVMTRTIGTYKWYKEYVDRD